MGIIRPKSSKFVDVSPSPSTTSKEAKPLRYITYQTLLISSLYRAEGLAAQEEKRLNDFDDPALSRKTFLSNKIVDPIHTFNEAGETVLSKSSGPFYVPRWQTSPVLETSIVNENLLENPNFSKTIKASLESRSAVLSGFHFAPAGGPSNPDPATAFFATLESIYAGNEYVGDPMSHLAVPIFDDVNGTDRGDVVGILLATLHWQHYMRDVLPVNNNGYHVVIENGCDPDGENAFTYQIDGPKVKAVGMGDRHDRKFSHYHVDGYISRNNIEDGTPEGTSYHDDSCPHVFHIFPTQADYDKYVTSLPIILCLSISAIFIFTIAMFLLYDRLVERRQSIVLAKATQSTAIVSSLFVSTTNRVPTLPLTELPDP